MILSVSRRTDIPNYYSEWFYNRIKEGYLYVRNPMNAHQISKIILSPEVVDCIVFWTKNPEPMFSRLDELDAYQYYFQFTLTGFGNDIECNVPHKKEHMIPVFQKLAKRIGKQKMIWRYDPIIFTDKYTPEYHLKAFRQIAEELNGYTSKCVISFVDIYTKNRKKLTAAIGKKKYKVKKAKKKQLLKSEKKLTSGETIYIVEIPKSKKNKTLTLTLTDKSQNTLTRKFKVNTLRYMS